ncbi:TPA_asm: hypothetical protein [Altiarchaeum virus]|nr:TPA_asm: hypothetical protein [Altiarchaeum virus]
MGNIKKVGFEVEMEIWQQVKTYCMAKNENISDFVSRAVKKEIKICVNQKLIK